MEIDIHFVRNLVSENKIEIPYIPTEAQPASILTKALPAECFKTLRYKLTMEDSMTSLRGTFEEETSRNTLAV